jgi:hypothetical protein
MGNEEWTVEIREREAIVGATGWCTLPPTSIMEARLCTRGLRRLSRFCHGDRRLQTVASPKHPSSRCLQSVGIGNWTQRQTIAAGTNMDVQRSQFAAPQLAAKAEMGETSPKSPLTCYTRSVQYSIQFVTVVNLAGPSTARYSASSIQRIYSGSRGAINSFELSSSANPQGLFGSLRFRPSKSCRPVLKT